jgi:hypothetical protein
MTVIPAVRDDRSAPFFDGAANGRLMIKRCLCGNLLGPERVDCRCGNATLEWIEAAGTATLVSWIISHSWPVPRDGEATTIAVGLVELAEGPWMFATLLNASQEDLHEGIQLQVDFIRPSDGEAIPAFRVGSHE